MKRLWFPLLIIFLVFGGCAKPKTTPAEAVFSERPMVFTYGGYTFAARIEARRLYVRVPCCQTYTADDAFKALMLEAVRAELGCLPDEPEFTPGWLGPWQMMAGLPCRDHAGLKMAEAPSAL